MISTTYATRFRNNSGIPRSEGISGPRLVAPDDVAAAHPHLKAFFGHALRLGLHQIRHRIAGDIDETVRPEQRLDLGPRPSAEKRQPVADAPIFRARPRILPL